MKKLFLFCLLFLSISLFFTNCELDDTVNTNEQTSDDLELEQPTIKTVSYNDVGAKFNNLKAKYQLDTYMQLQDVTSELRTTQDTLGITIYTDVIKEITLGDYTSYTMRIAIQDSESTSFYNITLEDKGGEDGFFVTKYEPTDNWLADMKKPFEGTVTTMKGESFSPDEGGGISISLSDFTHEGEEEIEGTGANDDYGGDLNNGLGIGVGGSNSHNYSIDYPADCLGTVYVTYERVTYRCQCVTPGHLPGQCTGPCSNPGYYADEPRYLCVEDNDDNSLPTDSSDTNDTGTLTGGGGSNNGIGGAGDGETESITTVIGPDDGEPCDPPIPGDLNRDCIIDNYEQCLLNGYDEEVCDCIKDGGELDNCNNVCNQLKNKISENDAIKTGLHQLKLSDGSFEKGLRVNKNPVNGEYEMHGGILNSLNGSRHLNIIVFPYTTVIAHTHTSSVYYQMYSAEDILKFADMTNMVLSNSNSTVQLLELTHILVTDNGTTYALRFDNIQSVYNLLEIFNNNKKKKKFKKDLYKSYESNIDSITGENVTNIFKQQRHLFNLLEDYNLDLSLYEAEYDENGRVDDWKKINKESLEKEDCN